MCSIWYEAFVKLTWNFSVNFDKDFHFELFTVSSWKIRIKCDDFISSHNIVVYIYLPPEANWEHLHINCFNEMQLIKMLGRDKTWKTFHCLFLGLTVNSSATKIIIPLGNNSSKLYLCWFNKAERITDEVVN